MGYPIEQKLVIAVASSALFDLGEADDVFRNEGTEKYRQFQRERKYDVLPKGVAFPFIRRFLNLNRAYPEQEPVEVVLLSRNDPDTGQRVFYSIQHYGLNITRAAFLGGKSPHPYIPAFNVSLFLSANAKDVQQAIAAGYPAGMVIRSPITDQEEDAELRIAFDFDGVLADDEAEAVFRQGDLEQFQAHELQKANIPHNPGPLSDLFRKLAAFQQLEMAKEQQDASYRRLLRIAIVTARNILASERVVTTLNSWGVMPDETFFLGGMEKVRVLKELKPHIFFDDQLTHLESAAGSIPSVHVPFGVRNCDICGIYYGQT
ncbi:5'-nucleotidase [Thermosynechococcus sp. CL-1]|uniref:5'-nucleotidase n=1 Tax=Thermosynechococcus sp. CL-1 TaxID=2583530 RepID=UPI0016808DC4|nr:5'-nucleotidase [Thermosynechococcus sp. CL-1]